MTPKFAATLGLTFALGLVACTDDVVDYSSLGTTLTIGDGDGDGTSGDGDGTPGDGDGDGDGTPGDGDGTPGDGDGTPGDGDGTPGDGDGAPGDCGVDPGWGQVAVGQPVKHVAAYDHFGNEVNVCDWSGTPMVWDIAAMWCGPCQMASDYLAGNGADPFGVGPQLRDMINTGKGVWLTFLVEDVNEQPATVDNAAAWDAMFHNENIPVLTGLDTQMLQPYLQFTCWPTAWTVDPTMNFHGLDDCMTWNQLVAFVNDYGG
jgi:hypothetical protein